MSRDINNPTTASVIVRAIQAAATGALRATPARVTAYDASEVRCSAQPLVMRPFEDETGARQVELYPIVTDVPVLFLGGGGGRMTFPLTEGDIVLLVFSSTSLDRWLAGDGRAVDPGPFAPGLADAIAIPVLTTFGGAAPAHATDVEVTSPTFVHVGGATGSEPTYKGTARNSAEQTYLTALNTLIAAVGVVIAAIIEPTAMPVGTKAIFATALGVYQTAHTAYTGALPGTLTVAAKVR